MEIGRISNIQVVPPIVPKSAEVGPAAVIGIDNSARTDDETYTPGGGKSATGSDDESDEFLEATEEEQKDETSAAGAEVGNATRQINFFA
jgi:hypothetical protein